MNKKIKLILDTDPGSEMTDAAALTLLAISPEIEIIGVTTVTHDVVFRASVAKRFLNILGKDDIPVSAGYGTTGEHLWEKEIIFPQGYRPSNKLSAKPAWQLIIDLVNQNKNNVILAGIGPTANISKALENDPELPKKVNELVLMGGMLTPPTVDGKQIPRGFEYNFCNDSASIEKIIKAGFNLTLVPGDLTFQQNDPWTDVELKKLSTAKHTVVKLLLKLKEKQLKEMDKEMKLHNIPPEFVKPWVNDELLAAYIINPLLFKTKKIFIKWELPDKYPRLIPARSGYPITIVFDTNFVDTKKFIIDRFTKI